VLLFNFLLLSTILLSAPGVKAGTLTYSNQSTHAFSFSQISEISTQNYFLGPGNTGLGPFPTSSAIQFRAFRGLDGYHSLELDPGSSMAMSAGSGGFGGSSAFSASTRLNLKVNSLSPEDEIFGFRLRLEGIAVISERSTTANAEASVQAMLDLNLFGANGSWGSNHNINLAPLNLTTPGMSRWQIEWTQPDLKSWIQDPAFNPATMKVSELSLQFTPFFSLSTYDNALAEIYVNQIQVAVIPEPSSGILFLLGMTLGLRKRRGPTVS
jgi:hypothetical protein